MDIMVILQIIVLLGAIFVGVRLGGIGIGYAGGAGVLILGLCLGKTFGQKEYVDAIRDKMIVFGVGPAGRA